MWYAFTAGSVRVISLANDDVCYQDGGNSYVRGYSGGAQKRWLEQELERTRGDKGIDWIVVCMHQTAVSTGERTNGADLGIRENWLPLFDRFGVDLVVCGHEHHYERTHAIRGTLPTDTLTPNPVDAQADHIDTSKGTVHLVIGGGGTSIPSNKMFFPEPRCQVLMAVGDVNPDTGKKSAAVRARRPHRGRCSGIATIPAASSRSTSTRASLAATRRWPPRTTRSTGRSERSTPVDKFTLTRPRD